MPRKAENPWARWEIDDNGCWIWTGSLSTMGYGRGPSGKRGVHLSAHKVIYEKYVGPVPEGYELDHLCRVRACVNPDHLEVVTHAENVRRGDGGKIWREKTHCPQGHPYEGNNIKWYQGRRYCRECHRIDNRKRKARLREARQAVT